MKPLYKVSNVSLSPPISPGKKKRDLFSPPKIDFHYYGEKNLFFSPPLGISRCQTFYRSCFYTDFAPLFGTIFLTVQKSGPKMGKNLKVSQNEKGVKISHAIPCHFDAEKDQKSPRIAQLSGDHSSPLQKSLMIKKRSENDDFVFFSENCQKLNLYE